jgi:hypothetical protein
MRCVQLDESLRYEQRDVIDVIADIATSKADRCLRSAAALGQVCRGVITGDGPTASGRVHFSRTIDIEDAALCARILIVAGQNGDPVSRAEADALFDIYIVARERRDGGHFDDLFAKAVVHHIMSVSGLAVPRREFALALPLDAWASGARIDSEAGYWLETRMREISPICPAAPAIAKALFDTRPPKEMTVAVLFDIAS